MPNFTPINTPFRSILNLKAHNHHIYNVLQTLKIRANLRATSRKFTQTALIMLNFGVDILHYHRNNPTTSLHRICANIHLIASLSHAQSAKSTTILLPQHTSQQGAAYRVVIIQVTQQATKTLTTAQQNGLTKLISPQKGVNTRCLLSIQPQKECTHP